jgi:serine O-acetyltransferase
MVHSNLVVAACEILVEHLLPGRFARDGWNTDLSTADALLRKAAAQAVFAANMQVNVDADEVVQSFFERLPSISPLIAEDIKAAYLGDPAATSSAEIIAAYPGVLAVTIQRLAHELYNFKLPIVPRIMTEWAHTMTGVDIHPGAQLGSGFFIDHGTGVVIGETAVVGRNVKIYQGSTLGAKSFASDEQGNPVKGIKRHPTVEDDVIIYANVVILGGETVIGRRSIIGAGVYLSDSVPPYSVVSMATPELRVGSGMPKKA